MHVQYYCPFWGAVEGPELKLSASDCRACALNIFCSLASTLSIQYITERLLLFYLVLL